MSKHSKKSTAADKAVNMTAVEPTVAPTSIQSPVPAAVVGITPKEYWNRRAGVAEQEQEPAPDAPTASVVEMSPPPAAVDPEPAQTPPAPVQMTLVDALRSVIVNHGFGHLPLNTPEQILGAVGSAMNTLRILTAAVQERGLIPEGSGAFLHDVILRELDRVNVPASVTEVPPPPANFSPQVGDRVNVVVGSLLKPGKIVNGHPTAKDPVDFIIRLDDAPTIELRRQIADLRPL